MSPVVDIIKKSYKDTKKEILKIISTLEIEKDRKKKEENKKEENKKAKVTGGVNGRIF